MLTTLLTALALAAPVNETAVPVKAADQLAIKAKTIWLGDGRSVEDGVVLISGGKIERVGRGVEIPESATVLEHDGVLTAGMIALRSYTGAENDVAETTRTVTANCDLIHAFNPRHSDFTKAAQSGITSVVLTPPGTSIAGGVTCVVKTAGGTVVKRRAQLALSICTAALRSNRYPTSYEGLLSELDSQFEATEGAFGEAKSGQLSAFIDVRSRQDVQRAIEFAKRHGLRGTLHGANLSGEVADAIKAAEMSVIYRPFTPSTSSRTLDAAAALAEAGVPFGFGLDTPNANDQRMRLSAAMCVRAGVERVAAWKALTSDAAKIAGVDSKVGVVAQGKDADLVLWSGDPLDLGSRVQAVYIDGNLVKNQDGTNGGGQ